MAVQVWWFWAVYINPVFWSINGLVGTQLGDVQETMTLQDGSSTKVERACLCKCIGLDRSCKC